MQKKTTIRQLFTGLFSGFITLVFVSCSNLFGALFDPQTYNAQLTEMRIRTSGHIRMTLTFTEKNAKAQQALKTILESCSTFFATPRRPFIFAVACQKVSEKSGRKYNRHKKALRILEKQELLVHIKNPAFRDAVLTYVVEEKMMKKAAVFWEEAEQFVENQRSAVASGIHSQDSASLEAIEETRKSNPFLWALDHVMRMYASRSAMHHLSGHKEKGKNRRE